MKKIIIAFISFFSLGLAFAQSDWVNYQINNTLFPSNPYKVIEVDYNGNKWVATENNGLLRFDGTNWEVFNETNSGLTSNRINHIMFDSQNNLWIATDGGGVVKKTIQNTWQVFTANNSDLPTNDVNWITEDSMQNMWIGTKNGLVLIDSSGNFYVFNSSTTNLPSNNITCIQIENIGEFQDIKWIGTAQGLVRYDNEDWQVFTTSNSQLTGNGITNLKIDNNNNKWLSVYNWNTNAGGGLIKISHDNIWTVYNSLNSALPSNNIRSINFEVDNANSFVWLTTDAGIARFSGSAWVLFNRETTQNALPSNQVYGIAIERYNNNNIKWFGTHFNMVKYDGTAWTSFSILNAGIPDNKIQALAFNDNKKWIGTAKGLTRFTGSHWTVFNMANSPLPSNDIRTLALDKSNYLWIGTSQYNNIGGGLVRYHLLNFTWDIYTTTNSPLTRNTINKIAVSENNTKWIATAGGGLISFGPSEQWTVYNQNNSAIASDFVNDVFIDDENNKWIATEFGISVMSSSNVFINTYNIWNSGLPSNNIKKIKQDKNLVIWAVTGNGLAKLSNQIWTVYNSANTNNILNAQGIFDIDFDSNNIKWISTNQGLVRTNEIEWKKYDSSNSGLNSNNLNFIKIEETTIQNTIKNLKWIATADSGLSVFKGGEQSFKNDAYLSVFQHPIITNSLKISAIVNNVLVDSVKFHINNSVKAQTKLADNTWYTEHLVTQNQKIKIKFTFWYAQTDSTITRNVSIGSLLRSNSKINLEKNLDLSVLNDLSETKWVLVQKETEEDYQYYHISAVPDYFRNNLVFRVNSIDTIVQKRIVLDCENYYWLNLDLAQNDYGFYSFINEPGDYKIISKKNILVKPVINLTNYPNPFNPETNISFTINNDSDNVQIDVFDIKGRKVRNIFTGSLISGSHSYIWNGKNENNYSVASGIYFLRITTESGSVSKKMLLLK